jgi:predicted DsbA family dithiol-disulfide isomerase
MSTLLNSVKMAAATSAPLKINIISDTVCPFCYLGYGRLAQALKTLNAPPADISWQAYHLDPNASKKSQPIHDVLVRKFGDPNRIKMLNERIKVMGQELGFNFSFSGRVGHTGDSHRVVQLAKQKNVEPPVMLEIMKMYFEEGGDITSTEDLVRAAVKGGLDGEETRKWLSEGKGAAEVDQQVIDAYQRGVRGVPHFVVNDKWEINGAQDLCVFVDTLKKAQASS